MKLRNLTIFLLLFIFQQMHAKNYYVSIHGNDASNGTIEQPFATLAHAQEVVEPGDTVYIRGGVYRLFEKDIMNDTGWYVRVFDMKKNGMPDHRICYMGYPGERPIFDLTAIRPERRRISVFYVEGSYLHFRNFEIVGTQVTIKGHTQSECISVRGGSNNIFENLSMHDGMAIGFYLTAGSNNLVVNCDAYNNYDNYSEGSKGGNVDGFGAHLLDEKMTGNVFRGCRAWWNSDDGFDLINCKSPVLIDNCWSFYNGYQPGTLLPAGDGTGFKAGGYGMKNRVNNIPKQIPMHEVTNCVAYYNKNKGFYANHHLGGIRWTDNVAYRNPSNYCMLNRKSVEKVIDVEGYGHILERNVSIEPRRKGWHLIDVDTTRCQIKDNRFEDSLGNPDYPMLRHVELLFQPRKPDGTLPF